MNMAGSIFIETLRRSWRQVLYWGVALSLMAWVVLLAAQDSKTLQEFANLIERMPMIIQMFGISDAAVLATPEGFINFRFFSTVILLMAVFAVNAGLNVVANEEDTGIMDVLLSMPVPRWRVVLEKYLAYALIGVLIILVTCVGLALEVAAVGIDLNTGRLIESALNMIPTLLMMIAFTTLMTTLLRRKATATAVAAAFIVGSYFVNTLGGMASGMADTVRAFSFFRYYDNQSVMTDGLNFGNMTLLLVLAAVMLAGSLWFFDRRDIGA
jgi:ABC-2 type transport system permease protein